MPGILSLQLALLLASPQDAGGQVLPGITPELPGGRDAAFRLPSVEAAPPVKRTPQKVRRRVDTKVALPRLSSRFGRREDPIRGTIATHYGIDIPGALGTPVLAAAPGVVRFAGTAGSYGGLVEIAHAGPLGTRYAHLSQILVRAGVHVEQGQPVALMGSTGRSTGSHLHFEVRVAGRAVDPLPWFEGTAPPAAAAAAWIMPNAPHISAFARARADQEQGRAF